ncbi:RecX family transcriptional regulator [Streptomyces sp. NRRL S-350]|uniref:RecX family transcriptional regulator n=1 Tax=Streptomyces sp. NRRL S-350 TaxID=1463902 RepID=UPI000A77640C
MTQYDTTGGGPVGPEDDDYGPPDWFAAVAEEPEAASEPPAPSRPLRGRRERSSAPQSTSGQGPEFDRAPARVRRGAAPGPAPAEVSVDALGLVSASELPAGRRRRRSAVAAEEFETGGPASLPLSGERGRTADEAAGHGGVAASTPRAGARRGRARRGRTADGPFGERPFSEERRADGLPADGLPADGLHGEAPPGEGGRADRSSRKRAEESVDPETRARDICLRLLTGAAKSRKQLADALRKREIPEEVAEEVLTRLEEVGLIDDAAFAAAWVESRHAVRGLSRRALAQELRTKGVAADLVEQAVAQLDHDDETDAARALVERKLRSTRGLDPQVRMRRLVGMLARRGYSEGLAFRVVRAVLEEETSGLWGAEEE